MPFFHFIWSDEIIAHLKEHHVTPDEFEYVVQNPESLDESRSTGLPIAFGWTRDGRYLACIYEVLDDDYTVIPTTAYDV